MSHEVKREKVYVSKGEGSFGTLLEIAEWMGKNGVPLEAKVVYAGCGSHQIAFEWYEEVEDRFEIWDYPNAGVPDE